MRIPEAPIKYIFYILLLMAAAAPGLNKSGLPEQFVKLTCLRPNNISNITGVMVTRPGLDPNEYVLFIRDNITDDTHQASTWKGRVDGRQVEAGHVFFTLHNRTSSDCGTYTCRFFYGDDGHCFESNITLNETDGECIMPGATGEGNTVDKDPKTSNLVTELVLSFLIALSIVMAYLHLITIVFIIFAVVLIIGLFFVLIVIFIQKRNKKNSNPSDAVDDR